MVDQKKTAIKERAAVGRVDDGPQCEEGHNFCSDLARHEKHPVHNNIRLTMTIEITQGAYRHGALERKDDLKVTGDGIGLPGFSCVPAPTASQCYWCQVVSKTIGLGRDMTDPGRP